MGKKSQPEEVKYEERKVYEKKKELLDSKRSYVTEKHIR